MADSYLVYTKTDTQQDVKVLLKDNGDGIFSMAQSLTGSNVTDATFLDAVIVTGDSTPFTVGGVKMLTVEIYGTSTSRTVNFNATGPSGTQRALVGTNLSSFAPGSNTTGTGELWQFGVTGLASVIFNLSAVAGGNVTIKGKAVA